MGTIPAPSLYGSPVFIQVAGASIGFETALTVARQGVNTAISCIHPGIINAAIVSHKDRSKMSDQQSARLQHHYSVVGSPPSAVINALVKAVQTQQGNVYVGVETKLSAVAKRLLPRACYRAPGFANCCVGMPLKSAICNWAASAPVGRV